MPNDHHEIIEEQRHEERVDRTNVALILANCYFSLNQYIGLREGCEVANIMSSSIAGLVASTLQISQHEAEVLLWDWASDRAAVNMDIRTDIFNLTKPTSV